MSKSQLDYSSSVNYSLIDPLKVLMQKKGKATSGNIAGTGYSEFPGTRGESATVIETNDSYLAFVVEGLGTKNLVADAVYKSTGKLHYGPIAQDLVAAIINDLATVGARPLVLNAYWSMQSYDWFGDQKRAEDLISGFAKACDLAGVVWGGGETQSLNDILKPGVIELAGAAIGVVQPKSRLTIGNKLRADDAIVLMESSGIHANGLSLARDLAVKLPRGYQTKLPNNETFGEALLTPSTIYTKLIQDLYENGVDIHYMAHITGHGWRKIMRHPGEFTYRITKVPPVPPVLSFIQEQSAMADEEAYATFNMGAGYAIFVPQADVAKVQMIARKHMIQAHNAGKVEKGKKQVIIEPLGVTYSTQSLQLR